MKKLFFFMALSASFTSIAQVNSVSLQASGLTCSMCSNAINKALKTLDFVQKVNADIKTYTFEISFKANSSIDFETIKNKVESAGFSVSGFVANIYFDNVKIKKGQPLQWQNMWFLFIDGNDRLLSGNKQIRILDKGFVNGNTWKYDAFPPLPVRTYHVSL